MRHCEICGVILHHARGRWCAKHRLEGKRAYNRERWALIRRDLRPVDEPEPVTRGIPRPAGRCPTCRHGVPGEGPNGALCGIDKAGTCMPHVPWLGRMWQRA